MNENQETNAEIADLRERFENQRKSIEAQFREIERLNRLKQILERDNEGLTNYRNQLEQRCEGQHRQISAQAAEITRLAKERDGLRKEVEGFHDLAVCMGWDRSGNDPAMWMALKHDRVCAELRAVQGQHEVAMEQPKHSQYKREIRGVVIDVYDVLHAFGVTNPATAHAVKKLLRAGTDHNDRITDLSEAVDSLKRAIELEGQG